MKRRVSTSIYAGASVLTPPFRAFIAPELREGTPRTSPPFPAVFAGRYLTTKEQFHEFLEARGEEKFAQETEAVEPESHDLAEPEAKRVRLADGQVEDGQTVAGQTEEASELLEQPQAQKRARGQNKSRPHLKPTHYDGNRLCPSLIQVSVASWASTLAKSR